MSIHTIPVDDGSGEIQVDTDARLDFAGEPEPYITWQIPFSHAESIGRALASIDRAREILADFGDAAFAYYDADVVAIALGLEALERAEVIYRHPAGFYAQVRTCRVCGCTDVRACDPPCSWAKPDLCSGCAA